MRDKRKGTKLAIQQIDIFTGKVIDEFTSISEASKLTGVRVSGISRAVDGDRLKTSGGFKWKVKE